MQYNTDVKYAQHQAKFGAQFVPPRSTMVEFRHISATSIAIHIPGSRLQITSCENAKRVLAGPVFAKIPADGRAVKLGLTRAELLELADVHEGHQILERLQTGQRISLGNFA